MSTGGSEAERKRKAADEAEVKAFSMSVLDSLRRRIFNFYPLHGTPFKSILPDVRYRDIG